MKTIVALALILTSANAAAQINKCIDARGKVVGYGNECPAGTRSEASGVKVPAAPAAAAPAAGTGGASTAQPKSLAERDAEFRKRQMEKQEAEAKAGKSVAETERLKLACTESQGYLKSLQSGNRITRTDPKSGERVYLSDSEYAPEIAKAQRAVQANCK